ncbi:MAG: hypothetical protein M3081_02410 [Gemmatimonadota bacterium]|nr:hypothetical protein [Gemmatimonadota bacterium]
MPNFFARAGALALVACVVPFGHVAAQCRPAQNSSEAKLLAFYSVPIVFSTIEAPAVSRAGAISFAGELSPVLTANPSIERASECYQASSNQHSRLTSFFGRPRLTIGLPMGLALETSYIPPVTVGDAHPHLFGAALSETVALPSVGPVRALALMIRAHGTAGSVHGPITCGASALQVTDPDGACWGTHRSDDVFHPNILGVEGVLGAWTPGGMIGFFAGAGATWLRPRFQVDFTSLSGAHDMTQVEVDLTRFAALGGVTLRLPRAFALSAELYSAPTDGTIWRLAGSYRLR